MNTQCQEKEFLSYLPQEKKQPDHSRPLAAILNFRNIHVEYHPVTLSQGLNCLKFFGPNKNILDPIVVALYLFLAEKYCFPLKIQFRGVLATITGTQGISIVLKQFNFRFFKVFSVENEKQLMKILKFDFFNKNVENSLFNLQNAPPAQVGTTLTLNDLLRNEVETLGMFFIHN